MDSPAPHSSLADVVQRLTSSPDHTSLDSLFEALQDSKPSVEGLTRVLALLRSGDASLLAVVPRILDVLKAIVLLDSPPAIQFPGDSKSYVQLPSINLSACHEAYTLSLWVRLDDNVDCQAHMKSSLFRCRSPQGGVEGLLSEHHADGRCKLTMKVYSDSATSGHQSEQINGTIFLSGNQWHLITFCHSVLHGASMFKCYVDSNLEMEHELAYPFQKSSVESLWSFGAGLKGLIASVAMYKLDIPQNLLRLYAEAGPFTPSLDTSVTHPQGSFDSGHCLLGTQLTKGYNALRASQSSPIFVFTAMHFLPHNLIPYAVAGRVNIEHIEMVSNFNEPEIDKIPFIAGGCTVSTELCWTQVWIHLGGSTLVLYLIWWYVLQSDKPAFPAEIVSKSEDGVESLSTLSSPPSTSVKLACFECIRNAMELLETLLATSADVRDMFIQQHGFHLLSYILTRVSDIELFVNIDLVDRCFNLVQGLRSDADVGDGLTAALQGLLLNFKLWGGAGVETKIYLFNRVSAFVVGGNNSLNEVLFRSMGVQRFLDIMKQHCVVVNGAPSGPSLEKAQELMDAAHRLFSLAMNAALQSLPPTSSVSFPELQDVLLLLEETSSNEIAEKLLHTVSEIRTEYPNLLLQAMQQLRFNETAALHLLCDGAVYFSLEVRRRCLTTVMWSFSEAIKGIPHQLLELKQSFPVLHAKSQNGKESGGLMYSSEYATSITVKQLMKNVDKVWVNVNMLMTELKLSLSPTGDWLSKGGAKDMEAVVYPPHVHNTSHMTAANAEDVVDIALFDDLLGSLSPIVIIPFLSVLLPKVQQRAQLSHTSVGGYWGRGLESCQRVLMSLSVDLKTNEAQTCLLSLLPDISWMKHLLLIAAVGERHRQHLESVISDTNTAEGIGTENSGYDFAGTCTELALDSLAQVLVFKICHHGTAALDSIYIMQSLQCTEEIKLFEAVLSRRVCTLCIQKLSRLSTKQLASDSMATIANLIVIIEDNKYCDNELVANREHDMFAMTTDDFGQRNESVDLLGIVTSEHDMSTSIRHEGDHLLFFLFDFTASLRRLGEKQGASETEVQIFLPVLRILMGCFNRACDDTGDRLCMELLANLSYISEHWLFLEEEGLKRIVMGVLLQLQGEIRRLYHRQSDMSGPSTLLKRYSDLVVTIAQFFVQLRFVYADGLPQHVVATVEWLSMVEGCNDAEIIFSVLHIVPFRPNTMPGETTTPVWGDDFHGHSSTSVISFTDEDDDVVTVSRVPMPVDDNDSIEMSGQGDGDTPTQLMQLRRSNFHLNEIEHEEELHRKYFSKWLKVRRGISQERVDSEQARFLRAREGVDFSEEATARFWEMVERKMEAELFADEHKCEWKLGVAHEGYFPSRKRLILRPRFMAKHQYNNALKKTTKFEVSQRNNEEFKDPTLLKLDSSMSAEELQALLAVSAQQPGVLVDVHQCVDEQLDNDQMQGKGHEVAGTGFCVVDADDSEDGGFGVVGLAGTGGTGGDKVKDVTKEQSEDNIDRHSAAVDDVSDMDLNTGPSYSGTRRFVGKDNADSSNSTIHEADVVLISASGNHVGHMAFTAREIFFVSTPTAHLGWEGEEYGGKKKVMSPGGSRRHAADVEVDHLEDVAAVTLEAHRKTRRRKWSVGAISAIYMRRYRLRDSSIEVFFGRGKHRNFFIDFGSSEDDVRRRNEFVKVLMDLAPQSAIKEWPGMSIHRLLNEHGVQQRWLDGELSNFDYLMALNTLAGRSYNDLCQYPVFPWVLSQYTETSIDLNNPSNFRDLSKPMGALNEERLEQFLERFESFRDSDMPPFMYGSHYSTMVGVVLHYLVRLQPFASLHKKMQGGSFDVADRLFSSIPRTWEHNTTMLSEVKELTPEFFTLPDFLRNVNEYDLGCTQNKETVRDVELPPWASSPEEFIRINKEALESDYVSAHLHEWIDLIFGYKQRGPRAMEAHNVFYYLTYYGAVNRSLITDEATKKAIELQIAHFGQCPMEIFRYPHPQKMKKAVPRPLRRCFDFTNRMFVKPTCPEEELSVAASCTLVNRLSSARIVDVVVKPGAVICILDNGVLEAYRFAMSDTAKYIIGKRKRDQGKDGGEGANNGNISGALNEDNGLGNLISFDDFDVPPVYDRGVGGFEISLVEELEGRPSGYSDYAVSMVDTPPPKLKTKIRRPSVLGVSPDCYRDVLIAVEKEFLHYDHIQRVPISRSLPKHRRSLSTVLVPQVHCSQSSGLIFCYGRVDGGIAVRQLASKQAHIIMGGDFRGHIFPVCGLASDEVTGGTTDVVCSCDVGGKVLVWTVSRVAGHPRASASGTNASGVLKCVISRRPQRQFQCSETQHMCCDISWNLGVVVASHDAHVSIFSIERNERFVSFEVNEADLRAHSVVAVSDIFGHDDTGEIIIRRINLSDDGFVLLTLTVQTRDNVTTASNLLHVFATFSMRGQCVATSFKPHSGVVDIDRGATAGPCTATIISPVSFLTVPGRGNVAISGHDDGNVMFFDVRNLQLMYEFRPHDRSLTCIFSHAGPSSGSGSGNGGVDRNGVVAPFPEQAPILAVRIGPNSALPAVVAVTTASGGFYMCALPDFARWDKLRNQSTLAQLVHVPMQVVRGSLQQAQNLSMLASDGAGQLAQNAKSYADDAFAKINKSKLVKNVFGMFGSGSGSK